MNTGTEIESSVIMPVEATGAQYAADDVITWIRSDDRLLDRARQIADGYADDYTMDQLYDWVTDVVYAPVMTPSMCVCEGHRGIAALRDAVTREDVDLADWDLIRTVILGGLA